MSVQQAASYILIVEDEPSIQRLISDYLLRSGCRVDCCDEGNQALAMIESQMQSDDPYDLIILDVMLPGIDGLEICQRLREFSMVPVVFLTARHAEIDRLLGLRLGADDYISKPFSPRELVARVEAILRRTKMPAQKTQLADTSGLRLNQNNHQAHVNGQLLDLTPVEFRLLAVLAAQPGRVFRRDQLVEEAYEDYRVVSDRTIDSHIKNLRLKAYQVAPTVRLIHSVYGVGYRFEWLDADSEPPA